MSSPLHQACVDLAWSQWVALGVSGSSSAPQHPVDLESAVALAPILKVLDPRLYDESLDWCIRFAADVVSVARLKQVLKLFDQSHRDQFEAFAAIVNTQGRTKWPTRHLHAGPFKASGKSRFNFRAPAAVQIRARMIFGISARADLLSAMATSRVDWADITLLGSLCYTKRNIAAALSDLTFGEVVDSMQSGNRLVFRLRKRDPLLGMLGKIPPDVYQPWPQRIAVAATLIETFERHKAKSATLRSIEIAKAIERKRPLLDSIQDKHVIWRGHDPWAGIEEWFVPLLKP